MIDIHCHILPGTDDGSASLEQSRALLQQAIAEGISAVCITPHFRRPQGFALKKTELVKRFKRFRKDVADLAVELYLGNELYIGADLDELLLQDELCTFNDTRYVLIEFPFETYDPIYDEYLYNISLDHKIIIAHPERYRYVREDKDFVLRWLDNGYHLQANGGSLKYGPLRKCVYQLIEKGRLSFIASDAHDAARPLSLIGAYRDIAHRFNEDTADFLMNRMPEALLKNETISCNQPLRRHLF